MDADVFVNKASPLMYSIDDWKLQLRYRATFARVLDANRKFLDASMRYYELSTTKNNMVGTLLRSVGMPVGLASHIVVLFCSFTSPRFRVLL